jgi:hypothetical protein
MTHAHPATLTLCASALALSAAPGFTPSAQSVETYDFVEVEMRTAAA